MGSLKRIGRPRPAAVEADPAGRPVKVDGRTVESVRESWLVRDRWWTRHPLRRRYWEVLTAGGHNVVVYQDVATGDWHRQAA